MENGTNIRVFGNLDQLRCNRRCDLKSWWYRQCSACRTVDSWGNSTNFWSLLADRHRISIDCEENALGIHCGESPKVQSFCVARKCPHCGK